MQAGSRGRLDPLHERTAEAVPQPAADDNHATLDKYVEYEGLPTGYWANTKKFMVSLLKAYYGDAATADNDFGYGWLPRIDGDYSQLPFFRSMASGKVKVDGKGFALGT